MNLLNSEKYIKDLKKVSELNYKWSKLKNKTFFITGATGMIGSFLIDVIMYKNISENLNCKILAVGRNKSKAESRFEKYLNHKNFQFLQLDINKAFEISEEKLDFILHAASNTHPKAYATDPIGTITTNVIATNQLLELGYKKDCDTFVFLSSVEIYGENRGDVDEFDEKYCGYIDCNTLRAGYPESKRVGEALCQAYIKQKNMKIVIPRLSRVYGPTLLATDTKALSQFLWKALNNEDIVLKSEGNQFYSYSYVADAVSGILITMLEGGNGEAYNICNPESNITLKELALTIATTAGKKVIFELPDEIEKSGYSTATKATLDISKILELGWEPLFEIEQGISNTLDLLKEVK